MSLRRSILASAALLAATVLVAGCSSGGSQAASIPSGPPSGKITFWSSLSGMADVVKAFNASQKNVTVTYEEIPNGANGGYTKLSAAISAGTGPDVAGIEYDHVPGFVASDQIVPIDKLISADVLSKYNPQVRSLVTFADSTYAMPYDAPPLIIWYRQDLLKAAGVSVPTTWDEFATAAEAVKKKFPKAYLTSFFTNEPQLAPLSWQAGAQWFTVDSDSWKVSIDDAASTKVADYWQKLIDAGLVKKEIGFSDQWTKDLNDGTLAAYVGGSWSASGLKATTEGSGQAGKWVAAAPPTWNGTPSGALSGGTSFAITKNSKNAAAAAVFLKWLTTSPDAIKARGAVGTAYPAYPGLSAAAASVAPVDYFGNDIYKVFGEASAHLGPWAWGPSYDITGTALKDAVNSQPTLSAALTETQSATVKGLTALGLKISQ